MYEFERTPICKNCKNIQPNMKYHLLLVPIFGWIHWVRRILNKKHLLEATCAANISDRMSEEDKLIGLFKPHYETCEYIRFKSDCATTFRKK